MKRYISLLSVLLVATIGIGQTTNDTINRMVLVESTYNPIIVGASKHNFIPEEVKPSMNKEQIVYASENVDLTNFDREAQPAQAIELTTEKGTSGYAHLGYGNYNNLSGMAAYKWSFDTSNDLALKAHIDGWNGKLKLDDNTKWHSRYYDMGLNADYNIQLGNALLNAGAHATHYTYNYLGGSSQNANDLGAYAALMGDVADRYRYHATLSYNNFSYKNTLAENHIHGKASLDVDLYEWGMASVQISSDVLTYQGSEGYNNYFSLGITPQWIYRHKDFIFATGFNMDFQGGKHVTHPMQFSPECSISYLPDNRFQALFTLNGGREVNTFSRLHELSPYWASREQVRPTYTFMNAHLEGGVRIIEGLHLHLGGGYKILGDALFESRMDTLGTTYTGITNHKAQVAILDAALSYTHKDLVTIAAKGTYHHWMLKGDQALLARAPQLKIDVDARVRIIPKLYAYTDLLMVTFADTQIAARERSIIDWSLGANYALNRHFSFFLDAHNLLNRRYSYYTGYPAQGFNILAGAIMKF